MLFCIHYTPSRFQRGIFQRHCQRATLFSLKIRDSLEIENKPLEAVGSSHVLADAPVHNDPDSKGDTWICL